MALGKKCSSELKRGGAKVEEGLGFSRCSGSLGTKRVLIWDSVMDFSIDSAPIKKRFVMELDVETGCDEECSVIGTLSQDLLVRILCCVDHDDLKQLFHVSKSIREASLIAKRMHFAFTTPSKVRAFQTRGGYFNEIEAPNAPKQSRGCVSRIEIKKVSQIAVALFPGGEEEEAPRRR